MATFWIAKHWLLAQVAKSIAEPVDVVASAAVGVTAAVMKMLEAKSLSLVEMASPPYVAFAKITKAAPIGTREPPSVHTALRRVTHA